MEVLEGFTISDWGFQEYEQRNIDDLKHRLLYTTVELEAVRAKSEEEIRKNDEQTKQLLELLQLTIKQRDEARDQLRKLLNNIFPLDSFSLASMYQPENPPMISFPEPVSSFDRSTINFADSGGINQLPSLGTSSYQSCNNLPVPLASFGPGRLVQFDKAEMVIERLVANKPLPEKGKLLQAVMEAGPLLETLLVAGPLPRWRNPPPLQTVKGGGCDGRILSSNTIGRVNFDCLNTGSTMNFAGPNSGLLDQIRKRPPLLLTSSRVGNCSGKRQKSH